jgi:curved DNA-binding protein
MALEFKDYYQVLGVARTATEDEIKKAFRKLAREFHPDVAKTNKAKAEDKFKEINEAYEVLGDPVKRKKYDELGASWNQPEGFRPPPRGGRASHNGGPNSAEFHFGGTGFSDFFEQFFSRDSAGGRQFYEEAARPGAASERGQDIEGDILVTLDEALKGSVRSVSLRKPKHDTGEMETSTFRVKIPAGVRLGQKIRISGKGDEGHGGGGSGDLYLRVKFAKSPDFEVNEADLYSEVELAPWEAVLGASIAVPTLEKPVTIKIKPGAVAGQTLRIRGQGLPSAGTTRGDLYVKLKVVVPSDPAPEEKALWEQLAKISAFKPRGD